MWRTYRPVPPAVLLAAPVLAAILLAAGGCNSNKDYLTPDRLENGLVIILPGIEGESELNRNVRRGLGAGGVYRALPIRPWGRPVPFAGPLINQVDFLGNRLAGIGVANMITNYQDSHPGKPVHVVGHSGGGGVAVFAAEGLPEGRKIDGLILLSASISSAYDLTKAASRCTKGIVNFYNPDDAGLLGIGTIVMGTIDGTHGPSSGLIGFDRAGKKGHENVYQVRISGDGSDDPHTATTHIGFVSVHVAPWVLAGEWPASPGIAHVPDPRPAPAAPDPNTPEVDEQPDKSAPPGDKDKTVKVAAKEPTKGGDDKDDDTKSTKDEPASETPTTSPASPEEKDKPHSQQDGKRKSGHEPKGESTNKPDPAKKATADAKSP